MTLLDAPKYDPVHDRRVRNLLITVGVSIVLIAVIGVGGYLLGHGWFFDNLGIEHRASTFLSAVQDNDLEKAFGIWLNDPHWKQHPQNPNYDFKRFSSDWGPQSEEGQLKSYKVEISKRTGSGCIIQVRINDAPKKVFLWYEIKTKKLSFSPLELSTL
jgi:hypothetical protein